MSTEGKIFFALYLVGVPLMALSIILEGRGLPRSVQELIRRVCVKVTAIFEILFAKIVEKVVR